MSRGSEHVWSCAIAIVLDDGEIDVGDTVTWTDQTEELPLLQRMS